MHPHRGSQRQLDPIIHPTLTLSLPRKIDPQLKKMHVSGPFFIYRSLVLQPGACKRKVIQNTSNKGRSTGTEMKLCSVGRSRITYKAQLKVTSFHGDNGGLKMIRGLKAIE